MGVELLRDKDSLVEVGRGGGEAGQPFRTDNPALLLCLPFASPLNSEQAPTMSCYAFPINHPSIHHMEMPSWVCSHTAP